MKHLQDASLSFFAEMPRKQKNVDMRVAEKELLDPKSRVSAAILKITGVLSRDGGHYLDEDGNFYYLIAGNRLVTDGEDLIKQCLDDFIKHSGKIGGVKKIGYIFWLQQEVRCLEIRESIIRALNINTDLIRQDYITFHELSQHIGKTLKLSQLRKSRKSLRNIPAQIFLSAEQKNDDDPCSHFLPNITESRSKRIEEFGAAVSSGQILFVHALYSARLCLQVQPRRFPQVFDGLISDIVDGTKIGARGIVVHVGHNTTNAPIQIAVDRMRTNVLTLLSYVSPSCPLLIETPAAQGKLEFENAGEVLSTLPEMIAFYRSIPQVFHEKLGICVDTCHVFAAGYNPLKYVRELDRELPGVIKLIHFNDSKEPRYSRKDRHAKAGGGPKIVKNAATTGELLIINPGGEVGHIGIKLLTKIAKWALSREIPMVTE